MSVLIKGMEMPRNCCECAIRSYDANGQEEYCPITGIECLSIGRQDDCPLVEIPVSYVRLIDADAVIEKANHEAEAMSGSLKEYFGQLVEWIVDKTPTVIETEGEK